MGLDISRKKEILSFEAAVNDFYINDKLDDIEGMVDLVLERGLGGASKSNRGCSLERGQAGPNNFWKFFRK